MKIFVITILFGLLVFSNSCTESEVTNENNKTIQDLISRMTLAEKIGQMTQVDYAAFEDFSDIEKYFIGSVLWGGESEIDDIKATGWVKTANELMKHSLNTRLGIPILLGIDAVHGHNNVDGAVIFPHNIGLGCTRNPKLVEKAANIIAKEVAGTGIHWTFAPCVAVARNERWGRTYESFSEDPELVAQLGSAVVRGLEGEKLSAKSSILSCTKHFVGDGGTSKGKDQGDTEVNEEALRKIHFQGYISAIKENTGSIMVSFNSWNGEKLHGNKYLISDLLKGELGFKGFVVSDWAAIDQLPGDYKSNIEKAVNAGIDMVMIPNGPAVQGEENVNTYYDFITKLKELVDKGKVSISRINDAVYRILRAKFNLDIFNKTKTDQELLSKIGSQEHRDVARECVQQSLVLLKNDNRILPISKNTNHIHVTGNGANNIGMQCGGWTISWQGAQGEVLQGGTSILSGIKNIVDKKVKVTTSIDGSGGEKADVVIVVVGEKPYAEMFGDREKLILSEEDLNLIKSVKKSGKPFVIILLSGRPLIINSALDDSDAFVAAWLPGTEGRGIADVIFGDVNFSGKLSFTWPKSMDQIPINIGDQDYSPLFEYGFGLSYPKYTH